MGKITYTLGEWLWHSWQSSQFNLRGPGSNPGISNFTTNISLLLVVKETKMKKRGREWPNYSKKEIKILTQSRIAASELLQKCHYFAFQVSVAIS